MVMNATPADDVLDRTAETARAGTQGRPPTDVGTPGMPDHIPLSPDAGIQADALGDARPDAENEVELRAAHRGIGRIGDWSQRAWQFFVAQSSSSLFRRIVSLNLAGLLALSIGINFLSQFRAGLIDARIQSLLVQGQIIAGAIAASATVETDSSITVDPDKLLRLAAR